MKKLLSITLGLCVLGLINSRAADEPKSEGKEGRGRKIPEAVLKKYDKNGDGKLDESERAAMHADQLKKYDKNGDGKLDESERAAMREDMKKQAKEHKDADKKSAHAEGEKKAEAAKSDK